jgi:hypothetical protein
MVLNMKMFCGSTGKSKKKLDCGTKYRKTDSLRKGELISIISSVNKMP